MLFWYTYKGVILCILLLKKAQVRRLSGVQDNKAEKSWEKTQHISWCLGLLSRFMTVIFHLHLLVSKSVLKLPLIIRHDNGQQAHFYLDTLTANTDKLSADTLRPSSVCFLQYKSWTFSLLQPVRPLSAENQMLPPRPQDFITESLFAKCNQVTSSHRSGKPGFALLCAYRGPVK